MFERFTDRARKVVFLAKGKATERGVLDEPRQLQA